MKAAPGIVAFNSGELSPACESRTDLKQYPTGLFKCENFIPMVQGPARRRPGSVFMGEVQFSASASAITEFIFNVGNAFVLEWGDHYLRFWQNHLPVMLFGVPYEIATPYAATDLFDAGGFLQLVFVQSADVIYITHRSRKFPTQKLSHFAATNWTLAPVDFIGGPFREQNPGNNPIVYTSGQTGDITLTASANIFDPDGNGDLIGSFFQIQQANNRSVRPWAADAAIKKGKRRSFNGVTYEAMLVEGNTGTVPPTHLIGEHWDGSGEGTGVDWLYRDAGLGFVEITGVGAVPTGGPIDIVGVTTTKPVVVTLASTPNFNSGDTVFITGVVGTTEINDRFFVVILTGGNSFNLHQASPDGDELVGDQIDGTLWDTYISGGTVDNRLWTATATVVVQAQSGVVNRIPITTVGLSNATPLWAYGAFSNRFGYPQTVSFFRGRLCFGLRGNVYLSVSQDFENFYAVGPDGLVTDDLSISVTMPTQDDIQWMIEGRVLVIGTASAEHVIQEINQSQPLGQANIASKAQMRHGSRAVRPVLIGYSLLWAQTSGQKMRIMKYQFFTDQYQSEDLAALSNHLFETKQIIALSFQQEPDSIVWMIRRDPNAFAPTPPPTPPGPPVAAIPAVVGQASAGFTFTGTAGPFGSPVVPMSLTLAIPEGLQAGDLLVARISITGISPGVGAQINPITIPPGWTLFTEFVNTVGVNILYRVVDGTEAHTQTFTYPGPAYDFAGFILQGTVVAVRGADQNAPIDATSQTGGAQASPSRTVQGVTTRFLNDLILIFMQPTYGALTPGDVPATTPLVKQQGFGGSLQGTEAVWSQLFAGPGLTGDYTSPSGWSQIFGQGVVIAIKAGVVIPTPPPPPTPTLGGDLVALTFNEEQNVIAWHRHPMIGLIEAIASIPAQDGSQDEQYLLVNRTINGVTKRYIEYMAPHFVTDDDITTQAVYLDSASQHAVPAGNIVTGLGYLEGQTVKILADGAIHRDLVVTGGQVTLDQPQRTTAWVGLPQSAKLVTMPLEAGSQNGTAQGKIKRFSGAQFRLANTLGGKAGRIDYQSDPNEPNLTILDEFEFRVNADDMNKPVPPFSGLFPRDGYDFNWPAGYEVDGRLGYQNDDPVPATIVGIYPIVTVED